MAGPKHIELEEPLAGAVGKIEILVRVTGNTQPVARDQNPRVRIGFARDAPRQRLRGAAGHLICHVQAASQPT